MVQKGSVVSNYQSMESNPILKRIIDLVPVSASCGFNSRVVPYEVSSDSLTVIFQPGNTSLFGDLCSALALPDPAVQLSERLLL
jgi:hypothetical protein